MKRINQIFQKLARYPLRSAPLAIVLVAALMSVPAWAYKQILLGTLGNGTIQISAICDNGQLVIVGTVSGGEVCDSKCTADGAKYACGKVGSSLVFSEPPPSVVGPVTAGPGVQLAVPGGIAVEPPPYTLDSRSSHASAQDFARLKEIAVTQGLIRVIAGLQVSFTPEGSLDRSRAQQQRDLIASASARVIGALANTRFSVLRTYTSVPAVSLLLSTQALDALQASGLAARIGEDIPVFLTLSMSTPLVEATDAAALNRTGKGQYIAIMDTGVEAGHPFLQQTKSGPSKVVSEACFSNLNCPNGTSMQVGPGAGVACTFAPDCDHGTHVAGIAAGKDATLGFSGVARDAQLVSIRVFSNCGNPCAFTSDILAGLNHAFDLATNSQPLAIAAVNMSMGGGMYSTGCDAVSPWDTVKLAIDNLRSAGIATVISSGNDSSKTGVSAPSCISTAITVGATRNPDDYVIPLSNSSSQVELLAPGGGIVSSVPGGSFAYKVGTSMAAPHVAGAWAVLKQLGPNASVATVLYDLQSMGKPITDSKNGVTVPEIRIRAASNLLACSRTATDFNGKPVTASWDTANCYIKPVVSGATPFIWNNSYYVTPDKCVPGYGTWDGANCLFQQKPFGGFLLNNKFYVLQLMGKCPSSAPWDGTGCLVKAAPSGTQAFEWTPPGAQTNWYFTPLFTCKDGTYDGANCYIMKPPTGTTAFLYNNAFYYSE